MAEFDLSNAKDSCVGEAFVKGESVLGIRKLLDIDILMGTTSRFAQPVWLDRQ